MLNKHFKPFCIIFLGLIAYNYSIMGVYGQQITTDGNTTTQISSNQNVSTITTSTIKNNNAFNSFSRFNINQGNVVNLIFPGETQNLINIIKSDKSTIDGTLNGIQNSHIGGNMFLVNPYGVIIGDRRRY